MRTLGNRRRAHRLATTTDPPLRRLAILIASTLALAAPLAFQPSLATNAPTVATPSLPIGHAGRWITDAQGRVVIVHGLNQVYKVPPYEPSGDGFGDADAAFLAANGFDVVRVGVIWAGVEPQPGVYDDKYLASIATTVRTLAAHGVLSLLDFHQDLYNEVYQGEGAPAWAVQTGGLPNPAFGFPVNYLANLALEHNLDAFWNNARGPGGVGLQDRYAAAWAHVAAYFKGNPAVLGYELLNEPFPGTLWELCAIPVLGCPLFDQKLTAFYNRVDAAIRKVDARTMVWYEPNVIFNDGVATDLGAVADPNAGFAFHDYPLNTTLGLEDDLVFANEKAFTGPRHLPALMTEFGGTSDLSLLSSEEGLADNAMVSWIEWAYTGNDKTSSSPNGQALVSNPALPLTGNNVNAAKLHTLARPYPQLLSGVPTSWTFNPSSATFSLAYATTRAGGGSFEPGSLTDVVTPTIEYPHGYAVIVTGGKVVSPPAAPLLTIASCPGATRVNVMVSPTGSPANGC